MKSQNKISDLCRALLAGQVVTVPTETVNGYAASLYSREAVLELMRLKDRDYDSGKIFTLVPESPAAISKYVIIPPAAQPLISRHIPGEITMILPKNPDFHHFYFDEYEKRGHFTGIGIRIPDYAPFLQILASAGPLLLTSANPRGGTPESVTGHLPSTIVDFTGDKPRILRQGNLVINLEQLHD